MTVLLVFGVIAAIAALMLAVLTDTLKLFEIWRVGDSHDQGESRS